MNFVRKSFYEIGEHLDFFTEVIRTFRTRPFEFQEFSRQLSQVSWRALPTTLLAGLFTGAILAVQFYMQIKDFGAESTLGGLNTSGTLREVGPILIAFMLAGKVGAFTSAELSSMKASDQINALRCLGINPISFLVIPRFFAVLISAMLLLIFGLVISVIGGLIAAYFVGGINPQQYLLMIPRFAGLESIALAVSKSIVFGALMGHLCCKNGYLAEGGSAGVGAAVRSTAVQSMVAIVIADFSISWLFASYARMVEFWP